MTAQFEASWMPEYTIIERQIIGQKITTIALVAGEFMEFEVTQSLKNMLEQGYTDDEA